MDGSLSDSSFQPVVSAAIDEVEGENIRQNDSCDAENRPYRPAWADERSNDDPETTGRKCGENDENVHREKELPQPLERVRSANENDRYWDRNQSNDSGGDELQISVRREKWQKRQNESGKRNKRHDEPKD